MKPSPFDDTPRSTNASDANDDDALRQALRGLPAPPTEVDTLTQRVLSQWAERHSRAVPAVTTSGAGRTAALGARLQRHRLWWATAGFATVVVLASAILWTRPDPALEELMQPDVLSQIAIGEM